MSALRRKNSQTPQRSINHLIYVMVNTFFELLVSHLIFFEHLPWKLKCSVNVLQIDFLLRIPYDDDLCKKTVVREIVTLLLCGYCQQKLNGNFSHVRKVCMNKVRELWSVDQNG